MFLTIRYSLKIIWRLFIRNYEKNINKRRRDLTIVLEKASTIKYETK